MYTWSSTYEMAHAIWRSPSSLAMHEAWPSLSMTAMDAYDWPKLMPRMTGSDLASVFLFVGVRARRCHHNLEPRALGSDMWARVARFVSTHIFAFKMEKGGEGGRWRREG
jgi:hypothetical protein